MFRAERITEYQHSRKPRTVICHFMRDPKRIRPFLEELEKLWTENPDYRFGQLVMVIARTQEHNPLLFNLEEDEFGRRLQELKCLLKTSKKE